MSSRRKGKTGRPRLTMPAQKTHDPEVQPSSSTETLPPPPTDHEELAFYVRHHLNQVERLVIMLHYAEELELDEIASVLRMAQTEVEEIHKQVVGRLKNALTSSEVLASV